MANPLQVKWIAAAAVKTDPHDALRLAKLLAANLIPEVWVPPQPVRDLRALISHRRQRIKQHTSVNNRLHSLLHRQHLPPPPGDPFAVHHRDWWRTPTLSSSERLRVLQDLATLDHVQQQWAELRAERHRLSTAPSWKEQGPYLVQLPGFGLLTAMTVLSAIGDVTRFPTAKRLVGYAGLGAGVHHSGQPHRDHGITRQGRRALPALVRRHRCAASWSPVLAGQAREAAWSAVTTHPYWKSRVSAPRPSAPVLARPCLPQGKCRVSKHPNQDIVAVVRKLLVAVWHVLTVNVPPTATPNLRWSHFPKGDLRASS